MDKRAVERAIYKAWKDATDVTRRPPRYVDARSWYEGYAYGVGAARLEVEKEAGERLDLLQFTNTHEEE